MISFLTQVFHRDIFSSNKGFFLSNLFYFIFVIKIFRMNSIYLEVISPFLSDQKEFSMIFFFMFTFMIFIVKNIFFMNIFDDYIEMPLSSKAVNLFFSIVDFCLSGL